MFTTNDVINILKNNTYFNSSSVSGHCYYAPQKDFSIKVKMDIEAYNSERNKFECELSVAINKAIELINDCSYICIEQDNNLIFYYNP